MRTANLKITLLLVSALGVFAAASCIHEPCAGATCAAPARFDLVLTESDSGGAGISTGELSGVAFALDSGREHVTTSPSLAVKMADDTYRQFPDKRLFVFPPGRTGVFEITATGGSMAAFTFTSLSASCFLGRLIHPSMCGLETSSFNNGAEAAEMAHRRHSPHQPLI
jgi:hypothetical protein